MSKTKLSLLALLTAANVSAFAQSVSQSGSGPMTIQELTNRQADIQRAKLDSELDEARHKSNPAAPASAPVADSSARACDGDLAMYAVYGIGRNLRADFQYKGATITAGPLDHADLGGWVLEELTPTRALMVKRQGKKLVRCPVYLSAGVREFAAAPSTPAAADSSVQVPPISPITTSGTSAAKSSGAGSAK